MKKTKFDNEIYFEMFEKWKETKGEEAVLKFKQDIVTKVYQDNDLKKKIVGMMHRNNIPNDSNLGEDVLAELCVNLMKMNDAQLIIAYCDNYSRVFALSMTIITRVGFGKINKDVHPNASIAKSTLLFSNLNKTSYLCNTDDKVIDTHKEYFLPVINQEDIWKEIRQELNQEDIKFLDFLLDKIFSKKYKQSFSKELRTEYSSTEYKLRRLELQNKIRVIINNI